MFFGRKNTYFRIRYGLMFDPAIYSAEKEFSYIMVLHYKKEK